MNTYGIGGSWAHFLLRLKERISDKNDVLIVLKATEGLCKYIKNKKSIPNYPWYREIKSGTKVIAYVCGQGAYISTLYNRDMVPRGEKI